MIRGRKGQRQTATERMRRMADRAFRRDVNRLRAKLPEHPPDAPFRKYRKPDGWVGRTGIGRKILWRDEPHLMPQLFQMRNGLSERPDDPVDLRLPGIGRDCDFHGTRWARINGEAAPITDPSSGYRQATTQNDEPILKGVRTPVNRQDHL